jgi:hypothetical protein
MIQRYTDRINPAAGAYLTSNASCSRFWILLISELDLFWANHNLSQGVTARSKVTRRSL